MYNYTVGVVIITDIILSYLNSRSDNKYKLTHEMAHSMSAKRLGDIAILLHDRTKGTVTTKIIVELKITDGCLKPKHIGQGIIELKYADVATPILLIIVVGKNLHSYFYKYRSSASYMEIPEQVLLSIGSDVLLSSCDDGIVLPVCASDSSAVVPVDDGGVLPPGRVLSVINGSVMSVNNNSVPPADSCVLPACASDSSTVLPIDNGGVLHPRNVLSVNNCTVLPVDNCELPDHAGDSSIVLPIDGSSVVPTSSVLSVNEGRVTPVRYGAMLHVDNCEPTACAGSEGSVLPAVDGGVVPFGSLSPIVDEHVLPANVSNGTRLPLIVNLLVLMIVILCCLLVLVMPCALLLFLLVLMIVMLCCLLMLIMPCTLLLIILLMYCLM